MNGLNNSNDDAVECPLCMEPLEVDDLTFYPCTCGYQICRFCWHRIRTDENKLCPACRKEYPENPADFKPLTQEEMIAFKSQKRQRDQQRKQKITENRKHLANVRVVQKNLVFVVGLPPRLADADVLKKHEYFGKFGKIHKVVINPSTTYAGVQGPSASAYVTYVHNADALRAIQSVNNIMIDGRLIKTSLGTTKYCSHFMKNQQCPKGDCMYLHELGDPEASFTKEEMHQGKHQEYEKRLHDALIASAGANNATGMGTAAAPVAGGGGGAAAPSAPSVAVAGGAAAAASTTSNAGKANAASTPSMSSSASSTASSTSSVAATSSTTAAAAAAASAQQKEAWPSLSVSPVNTKESAAGGGSATANGGSNANGKTKKDKSRNEKTRHDKNKAKSKTAGQGNSIAANKENFIPADGKEVAASSTRTVTRTGPKPSATEAATQTTSIVLTKSERQRTERNKEKATANPASAAAPKDQQGQKEAAVPSAASESKLMAINGGESHDLPSTSSSPSPSPKRPEATTTNAQRSLSSSSDNSDDHDHVSESSESGKSSPPIIAQCNQGERVTVENSGLILSASDEISTSTSPSPQPADDIGQTKDDLESSSIVRDDIELEPTNGQRLDNSAEVADALAKLSLFDDSNSFFSSSPAFQQSLLLKNKLEAELRQSQMNSAVSSHLPDLLNGIDGYQKTANTNEWEEAFKNVMIRNNRHVEEQLLHQQHLQQQQQHHHQQVLQQQEEFLRMHELHKRNNLINNIGLTQMNGPHADFPSNFHGSSSVDLNRAQAQALMQQQQHLLHQQQQSGENVLNPSNMFGGNMSKFFDFHKSQQQQLHHQYLNGHSPQSSGGGSAAVPTDPHRLAAFGENGRVNPPFLDNGLITPQSQVQKQRLLGMFETMSQAQPKSAQPPQQSQQNRFSQSSIVDDDLGFDPFTETQKGLAELMENEVVAQQSMNSANNVSSKLQQQQQAQQAVNHQQQQQQQQQLLDNMQRARMPPPGFNHMNALGFGGGGGASRVQNSSKILPFMNMSGSGAGSSSTQVGQQHQLPPLAPNWNPHLASLHQHQGQPMSDSQLQHQLAQAAAAAGTHKAYSSNDWTSMDPAILSFRQFSSFPQQGQMPPHPQQQQDMFLQHLAQQQQQQQQTTQGFNSQSQPQLLPGMNMPNTLLNAQQSSQPQVNANVQGMLEFLKNRQFV